MGVQPERCRERADLSSTGIAGTINSEFITSSRPIKAVSITGDYSGVSVSLETPTAAPSDHSLPVAESSSSPGPSPATKLQYPCLPLGINQLNISAKFAEPARSPTVDLGSDGDVDWSYPFGSSYGHLWLATLDQWWPPTAKHHPRLEPFFPSSISALIPADPPQTLTQTPPPGSLPDSWPSPVGSDALSSLGHGLHRPRFKGHDGFLGGTSHVHLSGQMIAEANALSPTVTDAQSGREWKEIVFELSSPQVQTVSVSTIGLSYYLSENVSALQDVVTAAVSEFQSNSSTDVPITVASDGGMLSIGGGAYYDYITTNYPFNPPNTFVPRGEHYTLTTEHSHLYDNSQISSITLTGQTEDGSMAVFTVASTDGSWGDTATTSFQESGDGIRGNTNGRQPIFGTGRELPRRQRPLGSIGPSTRRGALTIYRRYCGSQAPSTPTERFDGAPSPPAALMAGPRTRMIWR